MRHLYSSQMEVLRISGTLTDGTGVVAWTKVPYVLDPELGIPGELMCRIDLAFVRPGKDLPMALASGRALDRVGVLFCDTTEELRAGDRLRDIAGPVHGTFELRSMPDPAIDFAGAHHLEVQVVEVAQSLQYFPSGIPTPVEAP